MTVGGAEAKAHRLEELARLIAAGRYRVPAEWVADAIIAAHRRGRRPESPCAP